MPAISDARILILATHGYEDSELFEPRRRLIEAGADVVLAAPKMEEIVGDGGGRITPNATIAAVDESGFDGLVLPGGTKNPDALRMIPDAVALVRAFAEAGKPVAAICHGPWMLIEADIVRGRTVTGWPSIRTDLRNAGGNVVDEEAAVDGHFVTSRKPEDIPAFTDAFVRLVETAEAAQPA